LPIHNTALFRPAVAPSILTEPPIVNHPLVRVGIDITEIEQVQTAIARFGDRYERRLFTPLERRESAGTPEVRAASVDQHRGPPPPGGPSGAGTFRPGRHIGTTAGTDRLVGVALARRRDRSSGRRRDGDQVTETIREILDGQAKLHVPIATLSDDDDLYDHGLTSHACVNVMLSLEDAYDIEFPDELLRKSTFQSVSGIRAALAELGVNGAE
jgi:acyl carrier protein